MQEHRPAGQSSLVLGGTRFEPDERVVMAIFNRTRDSFYDGGRTYSLPAALASVDRAVEAGAQRSSTSAV